MTYKTTHSFQEPGLSYPTQDILVVSDSLAGLEDLDGATEVNVFYVESTKDAIDIDAGNIRTNGIQFAVDETKARTDNDLLAVAFVRQAEDIENFIYIGRIINPSSPIQQTDFVFKGRVSNKNSASDIIWRDGEFGSNPNPVSDWSMTAETVGLGTKLSQRVGDVVDGLRFGYNEDGEPDRESGEEVEDFTTWFTANVEDRPGYYAGGGGFFGGLGSGGGGGGEPEYQHEARFANLLSLESALQMLLDNAYDTEGISITYVPTLLDITLFPARWQAARVDNNVYRYCTTGKPSSKGIGVPYWGSPLDGYQLFTGGEDEGSPFISWRLLLPDKGDDDLELKFSWRDLTIAELFQRIAFTLGAVLNIEYITLTEVEISFTPRSAIGSVEFYLRDVKDAKRDIESIANNGSTSYAGAANSWAQDGTQHYKYGRDGFEYNKRGGGFSDEVAVGKPVEAERYLPLTVSPTFCFFIDDTAQELGRKIEDIVYNPCLPHNIVFYSDTQRESKAVGTIQSGAFASSNLEGVHTAIYLKTKRKAPLSIADGEGFIEVGEYGTVGEDIFTPAWMLAIDINGERKYFDRMLNYVTTLRGSDKGFYQKTYSLTVPGLSQFKSSPISSLDWKNVQAGYLITLDSIEYIVLEIERKRNETLLKLQARSKYAKFAPSTMLEEDELPTLSIQQIPYNRAEHRVSMLPYSIELKPDNDVPKFMLVSELLPNVASLSQATSEHYEKVRGFALVEYDEELSDTSVTLSVNAFSQIPLGATLAATLGIKAGDRIYLRNVGNGLSGFNWSNVPPDGSDSNEDLFYEVGRVMEDGSTIEANPSKYTRFV